MQRSDIQQGNDISDLSGNRQCGCNNRQILYLWWDKGCCLWLYEVYSRGEQLCDPTSGTAWFGTAGELCAGVSANAWKYRDDRLPASGRGWRGSIWFLYLLWSEPGWNRRLVSVWCSRRHLPACERKYYRDSGFFFGWSCSIAERVWWTLKEI